MARTWRPSDIRPSGQPRDVLIPVRLDPATHAWLQTISKETGRPVGVIAASMLQEIRNDDEGEPDR